MLGCKLFKGLSNVEVGSVEFVVDGGIYLNLFRGVGAVEPHKLVGGAQPRIPVRRFEDDIPAFGVLDGGTFADQVLAVAGSKGRSDDGDRLHHSGAKHLGNFLGAGAAFDGARNRFAEHRTPKNLANPLFRLAVVSDLALDELVEFGAGPGVGALKLVGNRLLDIGVLVNHLFAVALVLESVFKLVEGEIVGDFGERKRIWFRRFAWRTRHTYRASGGGNMPPIAGGAPAPTGSSAASGGGPPAAGVKVAQT